MTSPTLRRSREAYARTSPHKKPTQTYISMGTKQKNLCPRPRAARSVVFSSLTHAGGEVRASAATHKTHANPFTPTVTSLHSSSPPPIFQRSLQTDLRTVNLSAPHSECVLILPRGPQFQYQNPLRPGPVHNANTSLRFSVPIPTAPRRRRNNNTVHSGSTSRLPSIHVA